MQFRKSWDQLLIPLRKARMDLYPGEPLTVPQDAKPREIATARREWNARMQRLTELARPRHQNRLADACPKAPNR